MRPGNSQANRLSRPAQISNGQKTGISGVFARRRLDECVSGQPSAPVAMSLDLDVLTRDQTRQSALTAIKRQERTGHSCAGCSDLLKQPEKTCNDHPCARPLADRHRPGGGVGAIRRIVTEFSFFPLWVGYILVLNGMSEVLFQDSPIRRMGRSFFGLFVLSVPMWWFFELMNSFVHNWHYIFAHPGSDLQDNVQASIDFSTAMPAVLSTGYCLRHQFLLQHSRFSHCVPVQARRSHLFLFVLIGLAALCIIPVFPNVNISASLDCSHPAAGAAGLYRRHAILLALAGKRSMPAGRLAHACHLVHRVLVGDMELLFPAKVGLYGPLLRLLEDFRYASSGISWLSVLRLDRLHLCGADRFCLVQVGSNASVRSVA